MKRNNSKIALLRILMERQKEMLSYLFIYFFPASFLSEDHFPWLSGFVKLYLPWWLAAECALLSVKGSLKFMAEFIWSLWVPIPGSKILLSETKLAFFGVTAKSDTTKLITLRCLPSYFITSWANLFSQWYCYRSQSLLCSHFMNWDHLNIVIDI